MITNYLSFQTLLLGTVISMHFDAHRFGKNHPGLELRVPEIIFSSIQPIASLRSLSCLSQFNRSVTTKNNEGLLQSCLVTQATVVH